ncbi:hypothetical protein ACRZ5S_22510 (plasmid) [Vibrio scophthalmi]|uniref:hypothetical protein n=1 Tax=Vibrio scophthalmi TaxID=45658 RepID=UPI003EBF83ED
MGLAADTGRYGYGISWVDANKHFISKVPLMPRSAIQKQFKSLNAARSWQLKVAHAEWGLDRWGLIKRGRLSILRKFECGVSVRTCVSKTSRKDGTIGSYVLFGVFWYDHDGKPKSKMFSHRKYADRAEIEANWFAAQQRAILTNSDLKLPDSMDAQSFDLESAIQINRGKDFLPMK